MKLNWANRVTILRIVLIVPFIILMLRQNDVDLSESAQYWIRYAAIATFFVMAGSDALDGYLARSRGQVTRLGAFLDPVADKLLMTSACLLLASPQGGVTGFMLPITVLVLIIGKDMFSLIGFLVIYFITSQVKVVPVLVGKAATWLQLAMVIGVLLAPEFSRMMPWWIWFLQVLWWSAAGVAIAASLIYIRTGSRYIEEYQQSVAVMK